MKVFLLTIFLCVMTVATTFGLDLSLGPGLSVKNAILYTILLFYTVETAVYHNRRFDLPSVLIPFGLLFFYCVLSWAITSFVIQLSDYVPLRAGLSLKTERFDHLIVFLLFFFGLQSTKETLTVIRVFVWIIAVGNLITVIDGFNIPDLGFIQQREDGRLGGPMGESNQYGALLVLTLPATLALLWDPKSRKWQAILASFVSVLALLIASSRGSFVGIVIGSLFSVHFLRSYVSMRQVSVAAIVSFVVLVLILGLFLSTDLFSDLMDRFMDKTSGTAQTVTSGRNRIWSTGLEQMSEQPWSFLFGFGWDSWDYINRAGSNTHNVYLNHLFNLGLIGLSLFCFLLYNLVSACRRAIENASGIARIHLMAFVFGFSSLCLAVFFVDLYRPWTFIWAYAGLVMRLVVASDRETAADVEDNPATQLAEARRF
jgi:hypothetical protein